MSRAGANASQREEQRALSLADLKIRTKDRQIIPFDLNPVQASYLDTLLGGEEYSPGALVGRREIILKARQFGFSTLILALFFLDTITTPNTQTVVIAHDTDSTERLFQTVQRFYRLLPAASRPRTKYANRREFLWPELDSYFFVGTAGAGEFGRGGTINNVHGSEVAFWPNGDDLVAGLLQTVPPEGNVFLETTANGLGNFFHGEFTAAERHDSVFAPRFYAWHQHHEYQVEPEAGFARTEEEEKLTEAYGLTEAQLQWRRGKVKELRGKMPQEYPANSREAFLTSGNPYFDRDHLSELSDRLAGSDYDPISATAPAGSSRLRNALTLNQLSLWQEPIAGRAYVIGADTAEGLTDSGDADFDCADVFDAETWEQVAHLHGKWDTHEYGLLLAELGTWYNVALLGIERNNHGHAVINAALHTAGYPLMQGCSGMYLHLEYDEKNKPLPNQRPGWPTTPKSKFFMLDGLASSLLPEGDLKLRARHTVAELLTYVKLPGGGAGGEGKSHDDAVVSCGLAAVMLKLRPRTTTREVQFF